MLMVVMILPIPLYAATPGIYPWIQGGFGYLYGYQKECISGGRFGLFAGDWLNFLGGHWQYSRKLGITMTLRAKFSEHKDNGIELYQANMQDIVVKYAGIALGEIHGFIFRVVVGMGLV